MHPEVMSAWEAFHAAALARRGDLRNPDKAAALMRARETLDRILAAALAGVPYRARHVADLRPGRDGGHVHLAVLRDVALGGWHRRAGQTLCGAVPGRGAPERPVTCTACLRLVERHYGMEEAPPELPLS